MQGVQTPLRITNPEDLSAGSDNDMDVGAKSPMKTPLSAPGAKCKINAAIGEGNIERVREYLKPRGNFIANARDPDEGYTPLITTMALADEAQAEEICKALLASQAIPTIGDNEGSNSIHWAARLGKSKLLPLLLEKLNPITVFVSNHDGDTPLHEASREGHLGCCEILLEYVKNHLPQLNKSSSSTSDLKSEASTPVVKQESDVSPAKTPKNLTSSLKSEHPNSESKKGHVSISDTTTVISPTPNGDTINTVSGSKVAQPVNQAPDALLHRNKNGDSAFDIAGDHFGNDREINPRDKEGKKQLANEKSQNRQSIQLLFCSSFPYFKTLILYHDDCLQHIPVGDKDKDIWEAPGRLHEILKTVREAQQEDRIIMTNKFNKASRKMLELAHSKDYVSFVHDLSLNITPTTPVPFTPRVQQSMQNVPDEQLKRPELCDTSFSKGSLDAALRGCGAVCHAIDQVVLKKQRNAFCIVRPPGHHAGIDGLMKNASSCGFCIFNNVMVGALNAMKTHPKLLKKIAIIDFDVHHGNGTEEIVVKHNAKQTGESDILFFSAHIYDSARSGSTYEFYPGSGKESKMNSNVINVPLQPLWRRKGAKAVWPKKPSWAERFYHDHFGRTEFRRVITERMIPPLRAFHPDLIIISAGFDAGAKDVGNGRYMPRYKSGFDLRKDDFFWVTAEISKVANVCCDGRVVSVLEGGYGKLAIQKDTKKFKIDRSSLAQNCLGHISGLLDTQKMLIDNDEEESDETVSDEEEENTSQVQNETGDSKPVTDRRTRTRRRPARFSNEVVDDDAKVRPRKDDDEDSVSSTSDQGKGSRGTKRNSRPRRARKNNSNSEDSEAEFSDAEGDTDDKPRNRRAKARKDGKDRKQSADAKKRKSSDGQVKKRKSDNMDDPSGGDDRFAKREKRELRKEDALQYLHEVKEKYEGRPQTYKTFLRIMGDFKNEALSVVDVIEKVKELFKGDNNLIFGFNTFLPDGYKISLADLPPEDGSASGSAVSAQALQAMQQQQPFASQYPVAQMALAQGNSYLPGVQTDTNSMMEYHQQLQQQLQQQYQQALNFYQSQPHFQQQQQQQLALMQQQAEYVNPMAAQQQQLQQQMSLQAQIQNMQQQLNPLQQQVSSAATSVTTGAGTQQQQPIGSIGTTITTGVSSTNSSTTNTNNETKG